MLQKRVRNGWRRGRICRRRRNSRADRSIWGRFAQMSRAAMSTASYARKRYALRSPTNPQGGRRGRCRFGSMGGRSAVRLARALVARAARGCCDDRLLMVLRSLACGAISLCRSGRLCVLRYPVVASAGSISFFWSAVSPDCRMFWFRKSLGATERQGLIAVVLGRAAGPSGQESLPQWTKRYFEFILSAVARSPCSRSPAISARSLYICLSPSTQCVVDDGSTLETR